MSTTQKNTRAVTPSDEVADEALRRATALADGLFPHQVEGLAFLLGRRRVVEVAAEDLRMRYEQTDADVEHAANKRALPALLAEVIQALANALTGPSASKFEYRGTCKHVVEVRSKGGRK